MTDTAKRLYGPAQPGTSTTTLYTTPGATKTIVRNIHIANTSLAQETITIAIAGTAATAANHFYSAVSIPGKGSLDWGGFVALAAGETLTALQSSATACTVTISGIEET